MSSVQVRYVSTKTDNAFCSAVEQAVWRPLVMGSNPVCANRKSIVRVEMSKVSFIFGLVAQFGSATALQAEGLRVRVSSGPRKLCLSIQTWWLDPVEARSSSVRFWGEALNIMGLWCNGSIADLHSVRRSSTLRRSTKIWLYRLRWLGR